MKANVYIKESNEIADSNSDDSNAGCVSEEMNENADSNSNTTLSLTSTGKKRASRGAATDPQSLYARVCYLYIHCQIFIKIIRCLVIGIKLVIEFFTLNEGWLRFEVVTFCHGG